MFKAIGLLWALETRQRIRLYAWLTLVAILVGILEMISIGLVLPLIIVIADPERIQLNEYMRAAYNFGLFTSPQAFFLAICVAMICVFFLKSAIKIGYLLAQTKIVAVGRVRISMQLTEKYLYQSYEEYLTRSSSELIRNVTVLPNAAYSGYCNAVLGLLSDSIVVIGILILMLLVEPVATASAFGILAVIFVMLNTALRESNKKLGAEWTRLSEKQLSVLQQGLAGLKLTRVLGCEGYFIDKFRHIQNTIARVNERLNFIQQLPGVVNELVVLTAMLLAVIYILLSQVNHANSLATLGLFATAAIRLMPMANRIIGAFSQFQRHETAMLVLNRELSSIVAPSIPKIISYDVIPFQKSIRLDSVSFTYGVGQEALSDINFEIGKGEFVGVVGESGSGKSTLIDILLGLLVPTSGHVLADGDDIRNNMAAWRRNIGYVPQVNYILNTTFRRNIAFATPDEAIDDYNLRKAISLACLDGVLNSLPQGLDTNIGENGQRLSVGQRQRIGIARAIIANPELIVLDEATASLDVLTETEISESISRLRGNKTIIVVAHRLSTLRNADRIILMEGGKISDHGSFELLYKRNEKFRKMVELSQHSPRNNKAHK